MHLQYHYLDDNNLFSQYQSDFRKQDCCDSHIISILHDIFNNINQFTAIETRT